MPIFNVPIATAQAQFPEYKFVRALTPSAQKAAFQVQDAAGNDLCLKIVSPNYERDRLDREIQALQCIVHPNVVKLKEYTFSSKPGTQRHFMVEEFIDGSDLAQHLLPGKPWDPKQVARCFAALADGLAALNEKNIVHRDLKPHNIRVRPDGSPVIIDFGLARHLTLPDVTKTVEGAGFGTPTYFAPEQFDGTKHDIDHRTDLFALGIIMFEALTGRAPFYVQTMTTWAELRNAVCDGDAYLTAPRFLALENRWQILLGRLLEKERAKRPADAAQVATILRKIGGTV